MSYKRVSNSKIKKSTKALTQTVSRKITSRITNRIEKEHPNFQFILWRHIMGENLPFNPDYVDEEIFWKKLIHEFDNDSMGNELELFGNKSRNLDLNYLRSIIIKSKSFHINKKSIPKEIISHNQKVLRNRFGDSITLYHGTRNPKSFKDFTKTHETIWTDSLGVAKTFIAGKGTILEMRAPVNKILLSHYGSDLLDSGMENEFIIDKNISHLIK